MPIYLSVEQLVLWHAVILLHRSQVWTNKSLNTLIFNAAIRGYALSYLSSCAGRIRFLLGTPGMVALDLDASLKVLFQQIVKHLESIPKLQGENISAIMCDLSVRNLCKSSSICYGEVF
jgi:NCK-associated protein 1